MVAAWKPCGTPVEAPWKPCGTPVKTNQYLKFIFHYLKCIFHIRGGTAFQARGAKGDFHLALEDDSHLAPDHVFQLVRCLFLNASIIDGCYGIPCQTLENDC